MSDLAINPLSAFRFCRNHFFGAMMATAQVGG